MKLIAITQRQDRNQHGELTDNLENSYVQYYEQFGIRFLIIPNTTTDLEYYFKTFPIEGIFLSGGNTINPELYGSRRDSDDVTISDDRDSTEKKLLEYAVAHKTPVFGVCRGFQFINVFFGGKLIDNIKQEVTDPLAHVAATHSVQIVDAAAKSLIGEEISVNSYHNQGVDDATLSSPLRPFAQCADGTIEAVYHPDLPIAAIEWHPERKSPDEAANKQLFLAFTHNELFWKKR